MISGQLRVKIGLFSLIFALFLGGFFVFSSSVNAWTEPTAAPTGGNVAAPINVSSTSQNKVGAFSLGDSTHTGIIKLYPGSQPSGTCETGQIYFDTSAGNYKYCDNNHVWQNLAGGSASGNFVKLGTVGDTENGKNDGWTQVFATQAAYAAVLGLSDTTLGTFGPTVDIYSAGIEGVAGSNSVYSYGVYGWDGNYSQAYAGYFQGKVQIIGNLCLGNVCRSTWPTGGDTILWSTSGNNTFRTDAKSNLMLGDSTAANAEFYVKVSDDKGSVVIGKPSNLQIVPSSTCGDGICQSGENNSSCTADCPPVFTYGPIAVNVAASSADIQWSADERHKAQVEYWSDEEGEDTKLLSTESSPLAGNATVKITLTGLVPGVIYDYRVVLRDGYQDAGTWYYYGNLTNSSVRNFTTVAHTCPVGQYWKDGAGCIECEYGSQCKTRHGNDWYCCSGTGYNCYLNKCPTGSKTLPETPATSGSLPIASSVSEPKKTGQVAGAIQKLSQSLLIPEAQAKTGFFQNIIPVAEAAAPFDAINNRRLTIYGGVATIFNGDASFTHALEIGSYASWDAGGIGLTSSGNLLLTAGTKTMFLEKSSGDLILTNKLYLGRGSSGSPGDLVIFRGNSCNSNNCVALTNENLAEQLLTLNYNNGFAGGTFTTSKFYVGFQPDAAAAANADSFMVKNNSAANSALYAQQSGAGYAGYFSGKVAINENGTRTSGSLYNLYVSGNGQFNGSGDDAVIKSVLQARGGAQNRGKAVYGEVTTYNGDDPVGELYAGYFKCTGPFDYGNRCRAGYFYGATEIFRDGADGGFYPGNYALKVSNAETNGSGPTGILVDIPSKFWAGDPKGIEIAMHNYGGSGRIDNNYGLKVTGGGIGTSWSSPGGNSYAIYAESATPPAVNMPGDLYYAGYFKGDVAIQGLSMVKNYDATQTAFSTFFVDKNDQAISCATVCGNFKTYANPNSSPATYFSAICMAQFDTTGTAVINGCNADKTTAVNKCLCYFDITAP